MSSTTTTPTPPPIIGESTKDDHENNNAEKTLITPDTTNSTEIVKVENSNIPNEDEDEDDDEDDLKILEQLSYESFKEGQSLCSLCNDPKQWRPTGEYYSTYAAQYAAEKASTSSAATLAHAREQTSSQIAQYEQTVIGVYGAYIATHLDPQKHETGDTTTTPVTQEDLTSVATRIATSSSGAEAPEAGLSEIPPEFFSSEFDIRDGYVLSLACGLHEPAWDPSARLAQLERWLDAVDARITCEVDRKGGDFIQALATLEQLREEVARMSARVLALGSGAEVAAAVRRCVEIHRRVVRQANYVRTIEILRLVGTVAEARRTAAVLVGQSDFTGALDLIDRGRRLLATSLAGVRALRRCDLQLRELAAGVEQRVHGEFVRLATAAVPPDELARNGLESRRSAFAAVATSEVRLGKLHIAVDMCAEPAVAALNTAAAGLVAAHLAAASAASVADLSFPDYAALVEALARCVSQHTQQAAMVRDVIRDVINGANNDVNNDVTKGSAGSSSLGHHVLSESFLALKRVVLAGHERVSGVLAARGDDAHSTLAKLTRLRDIGEGLCGEAERVLGDASAWSPVRAELARHMHLFLSEMQARDVKKVLLILDNESWTTTTVAPDFQRIMDDIAGGAELGAGPDSPAALRIGGRRFKVVSSLLMLATLLTSYVQLPAALPQLAGDIPQTLAELIQVFHRRVHQLILGAEATKVLNIKSISAKFLAVAAQTLTAIIDLIPHLRATLYAFLKTPAEFNSLQHLDAIERDVQDHLAQIFDKFVTLIAERVQARIAENPTQYLSALITKGADDACSQNMAKLCKEIASLHRVIAQYLFQEQIEHVFEMMCEKISAVTKEMVTAAPQQFLGQEERQLLLVDFTYLSSSISSLKHVNSSLDQLLDWIRTINLN